MEFLGTVIAAKYNYWGFIILMMIGMYAMIGKNNLVKKVIGMNIFQTSIILFYVSTAVKSGATLPILTHDAAHGGDHGEGHGAADAAGDAAHGAADAAHGAADAAGDAAHGAADAAHGAADAAHGVAGPDHGDGVVVGAQNIAETVREAAQDSTQMMVNGISAVDYTNPLPHVLMLTAIVVSVATLGVALALLLRVYRDHRTLDEDRILESLRHE